MITDFRQCCNLYISILIFMTVETSLNAKGGRVFIDERAVGIGIGVPLAASAVAGEYR